MKRTLEDLIPVARILHCLLSKCTLIGPNGKTFVTKWSPDYRTQDYFEYNIPEKEDNVIGYWACCCHMQPGAFDANMCFDDDDREKIDFTEPGWSVDPGIIEELKKYVKDSMRIYHTLQVVIGVDLIGQ